MIFLIMNYTNCVHFYFFWNDRFRGGGKKLQYSRVFHQFAFEFALCNHFQIIIQKLT